MRGQPMNQARNNANTGLSKTAAANISHCARIETLPMAVPSMPRYLGHVTLKTIDKTLSGLAVALVQTEASPGSVTPAEL